VVISEPMPAEVLITKPDLDPDEPDDDPQVRPIWLARGEMIGRYIVLECLGVGGMGVIYSAWDPKLDRKLAIKVVRDRAGKLGSTRGRARLWREGQALARLRHPNVVAVHDVGTHDGRLFVAMEFVEGETLQSKLLRETKPTVAQLINMLLQVGRGLAAAHRAELVHRDVKPENVMIGNDGRVMVLDFGIALGITRERGVASERGGASVRAVASEAAREDYAQPPDPTQSESDTADGADDGQPALANLTREGAVVGTPAYMSPEHQRGLDVDARSDQFSFCVVMWEALNGERPFGEGPREKLLARMRTGQIKPFRNREVACRVRVALRRGLAWAPHDRHESMEALLEAINPRAQVFERRVWSALGLGAAGGALAGVLLTALSLHSRPPAALPDRVELEQLSRARAQLEQQAAALRELERLVQAQASACEPSAP